MRFQAGLARRPKSVHDQWIANRRFLGAAELATVVQPLATLHDQHNVPACVGYAHGQGIESVVSYRVGCRSLWEGARMLQDNAGEADVGTRGDFAIAWLERHGWADEAPGEEAHPHREDVDYRIGHSLGAAMKAHRRRGRVVLAKTINVYASDDEVARQVVSALRQPDTYVVREGATTAAYQEALPDVVLGPPFFAGGQGGHAERIAWYDAERDAFGVQGSWGAWTWCRRPDGTKALGCCLISRAALGKAWAIDVVRVTQ